MNKKMTMISLLAWMCVYASIAQNTMSFAFKNEIATELKDLPGKTAHSEWRTEIPQTNQLRSLSEDVKGWPESTATFDLNGKKIRTEVYEYNRLGKDTLYQSFVLNEQTQTWENSQKRITEYDAKGNTILEESYTWNKEKKIWQGSGYKYVYQYDAGGNTTLNERYNWNTSTNAWVRNFKYVYQYDASGRRTLTERYNWDTSTNTWIGYDYKYEYVYLSGGTTITTRYLWNSTTKNWAINYKEMVDSKGYRETDWYSDDIPLWRMVQISGGSQDFPANSSVYIDITKSYSWNTQTGSWVEDGDYGYRVYFSGGWWEAMGGSRATVTKNSKGYPVSLTQNNSIIWNFTYDTNNNPTLVEEVNSGKFNYAWHSAGLRTLMEPYHWDSGKSQWVVGWSIFDTKSVDTYDAKRRLTGYAYYDANATSNTWVGRYKYSWTLDENDNRTSNTEYRWDDRSKDFVNDTKTEYTYDASGKTTSLVSYLWDASRKEWAYGTKDVYVFDSAGNRTMYQTYAWVNNKWVFSSYTIYYPNKQTSNLGMPTFPVGNDNKGSISLQLLFPSDVSLVGTFLITFPDGFRLDEGSTLLSPELSAKLDLTVTSVGNNTWRIEIKAKDLKSAQEIETYRKIIDVAYTVDPELARGDYDILIENLIFEQSDGILIIEESRTVSVEILRYPAGLENINTSAAINLSLSGQSLIIDTPTSETIAFYSVSGAKLHATTKDAGKTEINISHLPQGVLIVKGTSGWTAKVIK